MAGDVFAQQVEVQQDFVFLASVAARGEVFDQDARQVGEFFLDVRMVSLEDRNVVLRRFPSLGQGADVGEYGVFLVVEMLRDFVGVLVEKAEHYPGLSIRTGSDDLLQVLPDVGNTVLAVIPMAGEQVFQQVLQGQGSDLSDGRQVVGMGIEVEDGEHQGAVHSFFPAELPGGFFTHAQREPEAGQQRQQAVVGLEDVRHFVVGGKQFSLGHKGRFVFHSQGASNAKVSGGARRRV